MRTRQHHDDEQPPRRSASRCHRWVARYARLARGTGAEAPARVRQLPRRDALAVLAAAAARARRGRASRSDNVQAGPALDQKLLVADRAPALARHLCAHLRRAVPTRTALLCVRVRHEAGWRSRVHIVTCIATVSLKTLLRAAAAPLGVPARLCAHSMRCVVLLPAVAHVGVRGHRDGGVRPVPAQQARAPATADRERQERGRAALHAAVPARVPILAQLVPEPGQSVAASAALFIHAVRGARPHAVQLHHGAGGRHALDALEHERHAQPQDHRLARAAGARDARGRVRKELEECQRDTQVSGVVAVARDPSNLSALQGTLQGPSGTPYEGGVFQLEIIIPPKYDGVHSTYGYGTSLSSYVSQSLYLCVWVIVRRYPFEPPKIRFETKIWHPNISSQTGAICLDAEVAKMYLDDHDQFVSTARFWTETYAKERSTDDAAVSRLTDMGFLAVCYDTKLAFFLTARPGKSSVAGVRRG
ncbi:Ubiquitin-conjugating enzyme e2 27, partial [Globisporangium splendens]